MREIFRICIEGELMQWFHLVVVPAESTLGPQRRNHDRDRDRARQQTSN
jgi:hypothetical protein